MDFNFRKGDLRDADTLVHFLNDVKAAMAQQDWFYLDPPEVVRDMLSDGTMELWLAMDGSRLAGIFDILHPGLDAYNYGYDLDFSEENLLRVVHMDTAAVHPDYRGKGLQRRMVQMAEQYLAGQGSRILLTTVHPENRFSLNNMQKQGYAIQRRLDKYGSERYILRKDIF